MHSKAYDEETADSVVTRQFFIENGVQEEPLSNEQQLYLDAANKKVEGAHASPPVGALLPAERGKTHAHWLEGKTKEKRSRKD